MQWNGPKYRQDTHQFQFWSWQRYSLYRILSSSDSSDLLDGLRGAPIVSVDSGDLAGYIDLAGGDNAQSAALDDLIAEGWVVL